MDLVQQPHTKRVSIFLFDLVSATKLQLSAADGRHLIEPRVHIRFNLPFKMEAQFLIKLAFNRGSSKEGPCPKDQIAQHQWDLRSRQHLSHGSAQSSPRT